MSNELYDIWSAMRKSSFKRTLDDLNDVVAKIKGNPDEVIKLCLEKASQIMRCEASSFWILRENGDGMIFPAAFIGSTDISKIRVFPGEGIVGKVIDSGESFIVEDCSKSSMFNANVDKKTGFITKSMICVPCTTSKTTFGCIQMINRVDESLFDNEDLEMVKNISDKIVEILVNNNVLRYYGYDFDKKKRESGGTVEKVSVMVVDIEGFSNLSQILEPAVLGHVMNAAHNHLKDVVRNYNGYVDKVFCDSMLAYWKESDGFNTSFEACKAGLEMIKNHTEFQDVLKNKYNADVDINVSIYNGEAYIGYFGENSSLNDSPVGSAVKFAIDIARQSVKEELLIGKDVLSAIEKDGHRAIATYKFKINIGDNETDDIYRLSDLK